MKRVRLGLLVWSMVLGILTSLSYTLAQAEGENRIDLLRPDAPELAAAGPHNIGVQTLEFVHEDQLDIVSATETEMTESETGGGETGGGEALPTYDRPLTVEVWYPAALAEGVEPEGSYTVMTTDGTTTAELVGRAVRDAQPLTEAAPYPLIIISHGYPGNRFLLSHLGENLATKGYVVVSIDHTDSTYSDQAAFGSTLLNRPLDQQFVLNEVERLAGESGQFLDGLVNADDTGIIGYSMGGYGLLNLLGAGFTEASPSFDYSPPGGVLEQRVMGNEAYPEPDPRIKAAIAIGPWGMNAGFWDADGLAGLTAPTLFMAGSADDVSGYEEGVQAIFEGAVNAERYLLTFENARHNAAAPMPAPREVWGTGSFDHYADFVWNTVRMNNIAQHFATAFFDLKLKDDTAKAEYLDLIENAEDGVFAQDEAGNVTEEHTYWKGFQERTAIGLSLRYESP